MTPPKDKKPGPDAEVITEEQSSVEATREREQERKQQETEAKEREAEQEAAQEEAEQPESRTPEEIREDIRQTRVELGDTAEQLGAKSDVKAQAKSKVDEVKGRLTSKKDELTAKAKQAAPGGDGSTSTSTDAEGGPSAQEKAQQGAQQAVAKIRENPLPAGIVAALVVGFLLGKALSR